MLQRRFGPAGSPAAPVRQASACAAAPTHLQPLVVKTADIVIPISAVALSLKNAVKVG